MTYDRLLFQMAKDFEKLKPVRSNPKEPENGTGPIFLNYLRNKILRNEDKVSATIIISHYIKMTYARPLFQLKKDFF